MTGNGVRRLIARHFLKKPVNRIAGRFLASAFPKTAKTRLFIYHHPNDISWSQIYPYFHYAEQFERDYGLVIRTAPIEGLLAGDAGIDADIVMFQPWFTEPGARVVAAIERYRKRAPHAKMIFLDGAAHTDLRHGHDVAGSIDLYLRKALFHDRQQFLQPFVGDTNLTQYYGNLYGIDMPTTDWHVPPRLLDNLGIAPNFLTAPYLMDGFLGQSPDFSHRPIDLHSRIAIKGTPWYQEMRRHADDAAKTIQGIKLTPSGRIPKSEFLREMRASKLCWSPFGYGELCWRDLEAFVTGAVLVKPDMGHLETRPDLYRAHETYLPVKWDYSNLAEVVHDALAQPGKMRAIAEAAFSVGRNYLTSAQFVTDSAHYFGIAQHK